MDRITNSYVKNFRTQQSLPSLKEDVLFEHFANYCVVSESFDDELDVSEIHTGGGADLGIDGLAIFVNGVQVTEAEEVVDLLELNGYLDVQFIFIQAKTSSSFDGAAVTTFLDGIVEFFSDAPGLPMNRRIQAMRSVMGAVYDNSIKFSRGKPRLSAYYVTTGRWDGSDQYILSKIANRKQVLEETGFFGEIDVHCYGADEIQSSFLRSTQSATAEFTFTSKALLPDIEGITAAYVGVVPVSEFLKVVEDDRGNIRKSLFVENVRDFLESNPVNDRIAATLTSPAEQSKFAVLNNGVTVVTRSLQTTGNKFALSDYQIVNGCQTSHVVHKSKGELTDVVTVPLKVIHTSDEDLINSIVTATNSQTTVTQEDLYALGTFQKKLEAFLLAHEPSQQLFYERRAKQYNSTSGIEKVRIITKAQMIRAFAAMFLYDAHRSNRYYSALQNLVGVEIFNASHSPEPYYTAAFCYYKLEFFFRNGIIPVSYKPSRYHLLMAAGRLANGERIAPIDVDRKISAYCSKINAILWDDARAADLFRSATTIMDSVFGTPPVDKDAFKTQASTEKVLRAIP